MLYFVPKSLADHNSNKYHLAIAGVHKNDECWVSVWTRAPPGGRGRPRQADQRALF